MKLKGICFFVFLFSLQAPLIAQESWSRNIEWEVVKMGYTNTPDLNNVKSGFAMGSELRYFTQNNFSIGIASDFSLFFSNIDGNDIDFDYMAIASLTTDYYTTWKNNKRAFFGFSIGNLSTNTIYIRDGDEFNRLEEVSGFVFGPRIGFEYSNIRLSLQQRISGSKHVPSAISLSLGFVLWKN